MKEYIKLECGPVYGLGDCAVRGSEAGGDHGALFAPRGMEAGFQAVPPAGVAGRETHTAVGTKFL